MNNTASVSQFLAVLGGSANPALMQNTSKGGNASGIPDFRNMLFMQFGQAPSATQSNAQTVSPTLTQQRTNAQISQLVSQQTSQAAGMNIWQLVGQTQATDNSAQNALVLQLQSQGVASEDIETITKALKQSDLITIIRDPSLKAELENAINNMVSITSAQGQDAIKLPKLSDLIDAIKNSDKNIEDIITVDVSEMNMEEFKEWKKQAFGDLAAFFQNPKTKVNSDGEVVKILQGPAFLHDKDTGEVMDVVIDLIQTNDRLSPIELAIHLAGQNIPQQNAQLPATPGSFVPLPLHNLDTLPADFKEALQNMQLTRDPKTGGFKLALGAANGAANNAGSSQAAMNVGIQQAAQNSTMFSPLTTPADFNALSVGGDGTSGADFDALIPQFEAGFKTPTQSANPLVAQPSASQPHPTSQMVAISLTKMATGKGNEADNQKYRLQLDPPEMGRVDVELEFDAGHKIKALIMVEKPETLNLLQRDSHALLKALQDAGFDAVSQDNLNFNLSQGQNDTAGQDQGQDRQNGQNALLSPDGESELLTIETQMSTVIDPVTGLKHVNMVV